MLQHNAVSIRARARSLDIFERFSKILDGYTFHQVGCLNLMTKQAYEETESLRDTEAHPVGRVCDRRRIV